MVAGAVVVVEALPVTVNGKVDRAGLPAPDFAAAAGGRAPAKAREELVCRLFPEPLGLARPGPADSLFPLRGASDLAYNPPPRRGRAGGRSRPLARCRLD